MLHGLGLRGPAAFSLSLCGGNMPPGCGSRPRHWARSVGLSGPVQWVTTTNFVWGWRQLTWVKERGSCPHALHIHNGVEDEQDEEGKGAQRGDVGDGPASRGQAVPGLPSEHEQARARAGARTEMTLFSVPTRDFCLLE